MVSEATVNNTNPGFVRAMDPDTVLNCRQLGSGYYHGPSGSIVHRHRHHHGLGWLNSPQTSPWPSVVTEALDPIANPGCSSGMDPWLQSGLDITLALGGNQATHTSLFVTPHLPTPTPPPTPLLLQICLFPKHMHHSVSLSFPFLYYIFTHHNGT